MSRDAILMTSFAVNIGSALVLLAVMLAGVEIPMPYKVVIAIIMFIHLSTNYVLVRNGWWREDDK